MTMESFTRKDALRSLRPLRSSAARRDERPRRPQQDREVEQERGVLHVEQIVFELLTRLLARCGVIVVNLSPAGDARAQAVALVVHRHRGEELVDEDAALGPRSDEAHVALDHVPQLRELVEAPAPEPAADRRDARLALRRPDRTPFLLGADDHPAALPRPERAPVQADALLAAQTRSQ